MKSTALPELRGYLVIALYRRTRIQRIHMYVNATDLEAREVINLSTDLALTTADHRAAPP